MDFVDDDDICNFIEYFDFFLKYLKILNFEESNFCLNMYVVKFEIVMMEVKVINIVKVLYGNNCNFLDLEYYGYLIMGVICRVYLLLVNWRIILIIKLIIDL